MGIAFPLPRFCIQNILVFKRDLYDEPSISFQKEQYLCLSKEVKGLKIPSSSERHCAKMGNNLFSLHVGPGMIK